MEHFVKVCWGRGLNAGSKVMVLNEEEELECEVHVDESSTDDTVS